MKAIGWLFIGLSLAACKRQGETKVEDSVAAEIDSIEVSTSHSTLTIEVIDRETSPQEVAFHILVSWNSRMIQDCADLKYEMQKLKDSKNDE